jgi:DNA helicase-2/ATP-dependent DNA helicase PcrA
MNILNGLNPQQEKAVTAPDGPILVLAGPGSGKTRVLTHRVAYLIQERRVSPWQIMAVTFTNKAAREMRERVEQLLGGQLDGLTLGTFHATCARILRREADHLRTTSDFVIYDTQDQESVAKIWKRLSAASTRTISVSCARTTPTTLTIC